MDVSKIRETVHAVVLQVVRERKPEHSAVTDSDRLSGELGLKSLDLAQILALLEVELDGDPFSELVPVTSIRTVGDISDAYRRLFAGEQPSQSAADAGADRAERRLRTGQGGGGER